jgi:hypothetical protein
MNDYSVERYTQISTKFRTNANDKPSDCRILLTKPLRPGLYKLVYSLFPSTSYTINDNNNKIYLKESGNHTVQTITLTNGYYDAKTFPEAVESAFQDQAVKANYIGSLRETYNVIYDKVTGKLTIQTTETAVDGGTPGPGSTFQLLFGNRPNNAHALLGFKNQDTNYAISHTSDGIINLNAMHTMNISIDQIASISQNHLHGTTFIIPVPAGLGIYNNFTPDPTFVQTMYLHSSKTVLSIVIRDELNNIIDTNNQDFMFIIQDITER